MRKLEARTQYQELIEPPPHPIEKLLKVYPILPQQGVIFLPNSPAPVLEEPWKKLPPIVIANVPSQKLTHSIIKAHGTLSLEELTSRFDLAEMACSKTRQLTQQTMGATYYDDETHQQELVTLAAHIMFDPKNSVRDECREWLTQ